MKKKTLSAAVLVFFFGAAAFAHHGSHSVPGLQVLPGGGLLIDQPVSSISLSTDWYKGDRPEQEEPVRAGSNQVTPQPIPRNLFISTLAFEHAFHRNFSAFLTVPLQAYDRKDAPDYSRLGRVSLGGRASLVQGFLGGGFVLLDGAFGFPSGSDRRIATRADFWSGTAGAVFGWQTRRWQFYFRSEGQWPLSHLDREEEESGLQRAARYVNGNLFEPPSAEHHSLKKVTSYSAQAAFFFEPWIGAAIGGLYQDPFQGIVRDDRVASPRIYREASVALLARLRKNWIVVGRYRYPLERGGDRKRYEEVYSVSVGYAFLPESGKQEEVRP